MSCSWAKTAKYFNEFYGINLSKTAYRNWIEDNREPADKMVRLRLELGLYTCPTCKRKIQLRQTIELKEYMKWWRNLSVVKRRGIIKVFYEDNKNECL